MPKEYHWMGSMDNSDNDTPNIFEYEPGNSSESLQLSANYLQKFILKQKQKIEALRTLAGKPISANFFSKNGNGQEILQDFEHNNMYLFSKILLLISYKKPIRTEHGNQISYQKFFKELSNFAKFQSNNINLSGEYYENFIEKIEKEDSESAKQIQKKLFSVYNLFDT